MADGSHLRSNLGSALVEAGLLNQDQLTKALELEEELGGSFAQMIVKLGFIEEMKLCEFMAKEQGLEVADVGEIILAENLIKRLPRKIIERHCVLPIEFRDGLLTVAISDPYDMQALDEIQMAIDAQVKINLAPRSAIRRVINDHFHGGKDPAAAAAAVAEGVDLATLSGALIPLLIQKGVITEEELRAKARELGILK